MVESTDFDRFFRAEHPKLVACALAMTGDREPLVTLPKRPSRVYRAWSHVGDFERPGVWVRRVLVNLVIDGQGSVAASEAWLAACARRRWV